MLAAFGDRGFGLAEVRHRVGLGKTMIYAMIGEGRFPRPYRITPAAARWSEREVDSWIEGVVRDAGANGSTSGCKRAESAQFVRKTPTNFGQIEFVRKVCICF
jgi:prophage regulatory protein